jgi:hypothetical protein
MSMHLSRQALVISGAALALVAGGTAAGAAIASGPVDSSGVVHGCYTVKAVNGSHVFVLQDAGTSCPSGTTAITWNQQGPQGPAGASPDFGTVQVTQQLSPDLASFTDTCSVIHTYGPDAGSITVSTVNNVPNTNPNIGIPISGCVISGLPKGFVFLITSVNDACIYGPGISTPSSEPPNGGPGTPCPNFTADNSGEAGGGSSLGLTVSGDYTSSAGTDLLVNVPEQTQYYAAGRFNWQATAP